MEFSVYSLCGGAPSHASNSCPWYNLIFIAFYAARTKRRRQINIYDNNNKYTLKEQQQPQQKQQQDSNS